MRAGDRGRRVATWTLLGASLAGALLFVGLRLVDAVRRRADRVVRAAWTTAGVLIDPIDAPPPDLESGDSWSRRRGRSMESWLGARPIRPPRGRRPGTIAVRGGSRRGARRASTSTWTHGPHRIDACSTAGASSCSPSRSQGSRRSCSRGDPTSRRPRRSSSRRAGPQGAACPGSSGATSSDIVAGWPVPPPHAPHRAAVHAPVAGRPSTSRSCSRRRRRSWASAALVPAVYAVALGAYVLRARRPRGDDAPTLDWVGTWPRGPGCGRRAGLLV